MFAKKPKKLKACDSEESNLRPLIQHYHLLPLHHTIIYVST